MFLDSAMIVSLTQLLHRQLKPEPSSRYTWWLYSLIEFFISRHYPTTKFTVVSDTPENLRLAKQSKHQSQVNDPLLESTANCCYSGFILLK